MPSTGEVIFSGSKNFWRTKTNLEITIAFHRSLQTLEVVVSDPANPADEKRLYADFDVLKTKFDRDLVERETMQEQAAGDHRRVDPEALERAMMNLSKDYILPRLQISSSPPPSPADRDGSGSWHVVMQPSFDDLVDEATGRLDVLCSKPSGLAPILKRRAGGRAAEDKTDFPSVLPAHFDASLPHAGILGNQHKHSEYDGHVKKTSSPIHGGLVPLHIAESKEVQGHHQQTPPKWPSLSPRGPLAPIPHTSQRTPPQDAPSSSAGHDDHLTDDSRLAHAPHSTERRTDRLRTRDGRLQTAASYTVKEPSPPKVEINRSRSSGSGEEQGGGPGGRKDYVLTPWANSVVKAAKKPAHIIHPIDEWPLDQSSGADGEDKETPRRRDSTSEVVSDVSGDEGDMDNGHHADGRPNIPQMLLVDSPVMGQTRAEHLDVNVELDRNSRRGHLPRKGLSTHAPRSPPASSQVPHLAQVSMLRSHGHSSDQHTTIREHSAHIDAGHFLPSI